MKNCPDCGARVGEKHKDRCDVERCPHCGGQALGCIGFDPNDPCREPWSGKWPGEADCERLGFFVNGDRSLPDLNRLFAECPVRHPPSCGRRRVHLIEQGQRPLMLNMDIHPSALYHVDIRTLNPIK
jgi:hypothetical protein